MSLLPFRPQLGVRPTRTAGFILLACILFLLGVFGRRQATGSPEASLASTLPTPPSSRIFNGRQWNGLAQIGRSQPTIAKCTILNGPMAASYSRALQTHLEHSERHHYKTFYFTESVIEGIWSKPAALLEIILAELSKEPGQRLDWIFWHDADTIVMNKEIPLEIFLPPLSHPDIHFLHTRDWSGLNAGVFFLRVSDWSVSFLAATLAFRVFRSEVTLDFAEQSAMQELLEMDVYKGGIVQMPPIWFNAYTGHGGDDPSIRYEHEPGRFLIHFAGYEIKGGPIRDYLDKLDENRAAYELPLHRTPYIDEISDFWKEWEKKRQNPTIEDAVADKAAESTENTTSPPG